MKVGHTIASLKDHQGGLSRSVKALVAAIQERGIDASTYAADENPWQPGFSDLVHDHGIWMPANHRVARASRRRGVPRIVSVHGMLEPWAWSHHSWRKRVAWSLYQRRDLSTARVLHATTATEANNLEKFELAVPLAEIPHAISYPSSLPPRTFTSKARALFLSRLHPVKGLPLLLKAWARIGVSSRDWELVVAGPDEGGHRAHLEALCRRLDIQNAIEFLGPVTDAEKWSLYRSADLFVLPSHSENFGLVVGEALAAGLPVITTHGTPWAELETMGCGWWIPASTEAIAVALEEATGTERDELEEMGRRGREFVEGRMTWTAVGRQMISVYRWMLGDGPLPDCVTKPTSE